MWCLAHPLRATGGLPRSNCAAPLSREPRAGAAFMVPSPRTVPSPRAGGLRGGAAEGRRVTGSSILSHTPRLAGPVFAMPNFVLKYDLANSGSIESLSI